MDLTNFFYDFSEENCHVYIIYRIDGLLPVSWFPTEKLCIVAFEYYDTDLYDWVALRYDYIFRLFVSSDPLYKNIRGISNDTE